MTKSISSDTGHKSSQSSELYIKLTKESDLKLSTGNWIEIINLLKDNLSTNQDQLSLAENVKLEAFLADLLWKVGRFDEAKKRIEHTLSVAIENNFDSELGDVYYAYGEIQYIQGFLMGIDVNSEEPHKKSLEIREKLNEKQKVAHSLSRIGVILERKDDIDGSMEFYRKAIQVSDEINYNPGKTRPYTHIGVFHLKKNELEKAFELLEFCYNVHKEKNNLEMLMFSIGNLANVKYSMKHNLNECLNLLDQALEIAEKTQFQLGIIRIHHLFGTILMNEDRKEEAKSHLNAVKTLSIKNGYKTYEKVAETALKNI
jgi:tetratricopeptide (TPR) repeat protein